MVAKFLEARTDDTDTDTDVDEQAAVSESTAAWSPGRRVLVLLVWLAAMLGLHSGLQQAIEAGTFRHMKLWGSPEAIAAAEGRSRIERAEERASFDVVRPGSPATTPAR